MASLVVGQWLGCTDFPVWAGGVLGAVRDPLSDHRMVQLALDLGLMWPKCVTILFTMNLTKHPRAYHRIPQELTSTLCKCGKRSPCTHSYGDHTATRWAVQTVMSFFHSLLRMMVCPLPGWVHDSVSQIILVFFSVTVHVWSRENLSWNTSFIQVWDVWLKWFQHKFTRTWCQPDWESPTIFETWNDEQYQWQRLKKRVRGWRIRPWGHLLLLARQGSWEGGNSSCTHHNVVTAGSLTGNTNKHWEWMYVCV